MNERLVADTLRNVSADVSVGLPPVDAVIHAGQRRARNRTWAVVGGAAASVALIAATVAVIAGDDRKNDSLPSGLIREQNPLPVPWAYDEVLHLDDVTVPAPGIVRLVEAGEGAVVWADIEGELTLVQADGRSREIGEMIRGSTKIASDTRSGWVAWRDVRDDEVQVVVYDTRAEEELGRVGVSDPPGQPAASYDGPLSVDDGYVYVASDDGDFRWQPGSEPEALELDAAFIDRQQGTTLVWQRGHEPMVIPAGAGETLSYPRMAEMILSTQGRYLVGMELLVGPKQGLPTAYRVGAPDDPITFNFREGQSIKGLNGYTAEDIQSWSFTSPGRAFFVLLVSSGDNVEDIQGAWSLVGCELPNKSCRSMIELPFTEAFPSIPNLPLEAP